MIDWDTSTLGLPSVLSGLIIVQIKKKNNDQFCWPKGPCWFFLQNNHILFLAALPDEAKPGYGPKPLWPLLICTHRTFPLLIMRIKQQNGEFLWLHMHPWTAAVATLLSFLPSVLLDLLSTIFPFLYGQSICTNCTNTSSFPVGLRFKPALAPSPMWSSGWGLLGCWQISAERWSEGKPALEFGPVHQAWLGRGPRAGRCWPAGVRAARDSAVGPTVREQDQTIVRWRQQWECSGWTGEAGVGVEWRKQEGGTGSPCAQLRKERHWRL